MVRFSVSLLPRFGLAAFALLTVAAKPPTRPARTPAVASSTALHVEMLSPEITRKTYAKGRPPAHVKGITDRELGVCATQFGCTAQFRAQWSTQGETVSAASLSSISIVTRVKIEIWTLEGSGAAVAAHEETHRMISEHYYSAAGEIARQLAAPLVGRRVPMAGRGRSAQPDMEAIERELVAAFMWATSSRCEYAQARFDVITDHGRKPIANNVAMRQALAEEAAHWKTVRHLPPADDSEVTFRTMTRRSPAP